MEINDRVFIRTKIDADDPGTVIDFSDGMVLVHFDRTGEIGSYFKQELVSSDQGTILEESTVEKGDEA